MKRTFYIAAFTLLGVLLQFLLHALVEIWYIDLLLRDYPAYGFGLSWRQWVLIHDVGTVVLFLAGAWLGFRQGQHWWRKIYVEHALWRWIAWGSVRKYLP